MPISRLRFPALAALAATLLQPLAAHAQDSGAVPSGGSGAVIKKPEDEPAPKKSPVIPPKLVTFKEAAYPPEALKEGLPGDVVLKLTIDATGKVTAAEVAEGAGHGFDEAAQAAALEFVFEPATRDGQPVAAKILYKYSFTLKEAPASPDAPPAKPTTGNLGGVMTIAGSTTPLAGASVTLIGPDGAERKTTTDAAGHWSFEGLQPGKYKVKIESDGFKPLVLQDTVTAGEAAEISDRLEPVSEGPELTITAERPPREVTRRTLERREISRIPGTGGDALRSIQSLPGVARPPGLAGLLIVRGSAPQDTATFIDGSNVPLIYHFGGLSSVVPTELLDQIDFYPGNFSAQYGQVMGGIVDVKLRAPNVACNGDYGKAPKDSNGRCFHGLAQVDLIDARAMFEGPIGKDWSFLLAGRRSWLDAWLKPVLEESGAGVTTAPVYYDAQAIAETRPSATSRFSLRGYGSSDKLEILIRDPLAQDPILGGNLSFATSFWRAQALYEDQLTSRVQLRSMFAVGQSSLAFSLGTFKFTLDIYPITMRNEIAVKIGKIARINTGMDIVAAPYDVFVRAPPPPRPGEPDPGPFASKPVQTTHVNSTAFRPGWYSEAEITPTRRLRMVPGLRLDYARDSGHTDVSPRFSARYDLVTPFDEGDSEAEAYAAGRRRMRTTVKGGVGAFHQPPQFQETDPVFGTPGLYSNRAIHYSLGLEQELSRHLEVGVEGFYKDLTSLVSQTSDPRGGYLYNNAGVGATYGVETLLKYKPDAHFFGWLAYTISRSVRKNCASCEEYLFQYDQTHNMTVLGSYRLGRGWEFGARFRVISGSLSTPVLGSPALPALFAADAGSYVPLSQRPFSQRLPLFHQLDLRVDKRWQYKDWRLSAYLDVQNVYNNPAVEDLIYNYNFSQQSFQRGLPIIPSIGVRGDF